MKTYKTSLFSTTKETK